MRFRGCSSAALACTGGEIVEVSKDTIPDSNASASYDVNGPALRSALRSSGAEIVNIFDDDGGGSGGGDDDDVKTRIIRERGRCGRGYDSPRVGVRL